MTTFAGTREARLMFRGLAARPANPPRREVRAGEAEESLALVSSAFVVLALVCAWVLLQLLVLGGASEARSQHLLYAEYRSELSQATAPTGALDYLGKPLEPGSPVALLSIPQLGLQQVVVDGTAPGDLMKGPGHMRSTPLPGQAGISVVMGRASTYGAPFGDIGTLTVGTQVIVQNAEARVVYEVSGIRRAGDPIPAPPTGRQGRLTLVSAVGKDGFLGGLQPTEAIYVDATTKKASPSGYVAGAVPTPEQVMGRDLSALPVLVLLLAALVGVVLGISAARRRFPFALVWVFAVPTVIALAWATTDQVVRLLPNLM